MRKSSNLAVSVRRAVAADADDMVRVHARSWRATYSGLVADAVIDEVVASQPARIERWRGWLTDPEPPRGSFVAELNGRVMGFVFWGPSEDRDMRLEAAEVYAIYLDPDAIGRGIGRSLFAAAVDDIVARGFASAVLWVLETNERARRFYEAAGWYPDGVIKTEDRPGGTLHEVRYARALRGKVTAP